MVLLAGCVVVAVVVVVLAATSLIGWAAKGPPRTVSAVLCVVLTGLSSLTSPCCCLAVASTL